MVVLVGEAGDVVVVLLVGESIIESEDPGPARNTFLLAKEKEVGEADDRSTEDDGDPTAPLPSSLTKSSKISSSNNMDTCVTARRSKGLCGKITGCRTGDRCEQLPCGDMGDAVEVGEGMVMLVTIINGLSFILVVFRFGDDGGELLALSCSVELSM
jgi:hypothetical protein